MDTEAKRIMALSINKLYSSRTQRGGLRLHRSLLLSMTIRAAREIYYTALRLRESEEEQVVPCASDAAVEEPMNTSGDEPAVSASPLTVPPEEVITHEPKEDLEEDKENQGTTSDRHSRKRRGKTAVEPHFLPPKKARMDTDEERQRVQTEVLRANNGNSCRQTETLTAFPTNRAIVAC